MTDFDPETYNPFEGWSPNREVHQRLNQIASVIGAPAIVDTAEIDQLAHAADQAMQLTLTDEEAANLARETIGLYRAGVQQGHQETIMAEHLSDEYDTGDALTFNRQYALLAMDTRGLFPLSQSLTWKDVAAKYLKRWGHCDVKVSYGCDISAGSTVFAVVSGEFVCVYQACSECFDWFSLDADQREVLRRRELFVDDWDRK